MSLTIFTTIIDTGGTNFLGNVMQTQGTLDNEAVRQAGMVVLVFNLVLTLVALVSILLTVPKGRKYNDQVDVTAPGDAPAADQGPAGRHRTPAASTRS